MKYRLIGLFAGASVLAACSTAVTNSFPTPGSYNPLATRQPIDAGQVAIGREIDKIDREIDAGWDSGQLSRREARGLRRANGALADAAGRMGSDGLAADEQRAIQTQAQILHSRAEAEKFVDDPPKPD